MQRIVFQEQNGRRSLDQVPISRAPCPADGQPKQSGVRTVGFIEKSLAAQLALRSVFPYIFIRYFGGASKAERREAKVVSICADDQRIVAKLLNPVHAVPQRKLVRAASSPAHRI